MILFISSKISPIRIFAFLPDRNIPENVIFCYFRQKFGNNSDDSHSVDEPTIIYFTDLSRIKPSQIAKTTKIDEQQYVILL